MRTRQVNATRVLALAVLAVAAPAACGRPVPAAGDPPPSANDFFDESAGQDWSKAQKYIDGLRFETGSGSEGNEEIELCVRCPHSTSIKITPVRGVEHLARGNVNGVRRIVARITIARISSSTTTPLLQSLGLVPANTARTSYMLARGNGTATFMFDGGGKIRFGNHPWTFATSEDGVVLGRPVASWRDLHDLSSREPLAPDTGHISGIWLACAEGCCNAQPQ